MSIRFKYTVFITVVILPDFIHCHSMPFLSSLTCIYNLQGSTADSIMDSILHSLPVELANWTIPKAGSLGKIRIIQTGNLSRACPTTLNETVTKGLSTFVFSACLNVTGALIRLEGSSLTVSIGLASLKVSLQITKSVKPAPRLTLSIPLWKNVNAEGSSLISIFLNYSSLVKPILQGLINSELQKIKWNM
uniref:BPI1 domain-containing protein n=2 Tax=Mesocestoides corti TaxID=53468 RepID=A0A5K3FHG1_MESCO